MPDREAFHEQLGILHFQKSQNALETLVQVVRNLLEHPSDEKYRRIRQSNRVFRERVGCNSAALNALHIMGFEEETVGGESFFVCGTVAAHSWLRECLQMLDATLEIVEDEVRQQEELNELVRRELASKRDARLAQQDAYHKRLEGATSLPMKGRSSYTPRKDTGFVGLRNQGATCYLNALLQTLFHNVRFRETVYAAVKEPPNPPPPETPVLEGLAKVFMELHSSEMPASTTPLTTALGWSRREVLVQHDVQELQRRLLDALDRTSAISTLFAGKVETQINCVGVEYSSKVTEAFHDIALDVAGFKTLHESLASWTAPETLEGKNQFQAGAFGLQNAVRQARLAQLPQFLHFHLKRFHHDAKTNRVSKVHERFEFPAMLDMAPFVVADQQQVVRIQRQDFFSCNTIIRSREACASIACSLL
eukprot:TRINITY_DN6859_c0_g1_i1.p1 TRINITY_DN6859_c0_g1~~TRINITY_DN6859_c0_g1_i1.p1  ORF type:complete len:422 (-),score=62.05 TRINITY_DN6859_c0_g1_i1:291-1556(-)